MTEARRIPSFQAHEREPTYDVAALREIERRVLWIATRMVDVANRRPRLDGLKVGGHQASSASLVTVMTALWFHHLRAEDCVSVKPHASPVLHAIHYLLGHLDARYLTMLRQHGGLQAYPSRTKDPDRVDFSTGSVGLGAVAPLFAAMTRRYIDSHFGSRPHARFVSIIGDAELDEGNIWEAVVEPATAGLGNVLWIVDFNRQSLDRVVPGVRIEQWKAHFHAAGWHVEEAKYGQRLTALLEADGGEALRRWLDGLTNERYQRLTRLVPGRILEEIRLDAPPGVSQALSEVPRDQLAALLRDLGGHDIQSLIRAYERCDGVQDRPSVLFAYTVKGHGLPLAGDPRNHSALLNDSQIEELRSSLDIPLEDEWARLEPSSPAGALAQSRGAALRRPAPAEDPVIPIPDQAGVRSRRLISSQEAFGRVVVALSRQEAIAPYLVTAAPDVATSTNLAGFINRVGVFAPQERDAPADEGALKWREHPGGQHLELGISEMNLFALLAQLGIARELSGQVLLPIGTVYDPFVLRGLDALVYGAYTESRFVVAGTPSGIALAPEGGAHQSTITASVGLELPNVTYVEPSFAPTVDWLLCDALARIVDRHRGPGATYLRLSTRPLSQEPFDAARQRLGDTVLRRQVLRGAYRLLAADRLCSQGAPEVYLVACGATIPETLEAAGTLEEEGVAAHVVDCTSPGRLFGAWRRSVRRSVGGARALDEDGRFRAAFPSRAPVVTVHDSSPHALAWLGSALGVPCLSLGVDTFGESGTVPDLFEQHQLGAGHVVNAALAALELSR